MRNFIVYKEDTAYEKTNDWNLKMYQSESLLTLLKELKATDIHDYKTEEEAINNMSTIEGGWNGDGDFFFVIGEVTNNGTEFKILIQ